MPTANPAPSLLQLDPGGISTNIGQTTAPPQTVQLGEVPNTTVATMALVQSKAIGQAEQAVATSDFTTFFYNRIFVVPSPVDFGFIAGDTSRNLFVWNAYLKASKDLTAVVAANLAGVTNDIVAPKTFLPLEGKMYTVSTGATGAPSFSGTITLTINGVDYVISVTGTRAAILLFPHNWKRPVNESLQYATTVLRKRRGSEQRASLRSKPIRTLEYEFLLHGEQATQVFQSVLFNRQHRALGLPVWADKQRLAAQLTAGSNVIPVNTVYREYDAGSLVVLATDPFTYEVGQVLSVADDAITLNGATTRTWKAGTVVVPVVRATLDPGVNYDSLTRLLYRPVLAFNVDRSYDSDRRYDNAVDVTYRGSEVFLTPSRLLSTDQARKHQHVRDGETQATDFGLSQFVSLNDHPQVSFDHPVVLTSRAQIAKLLGFTKRMKGQWKSCWVPSWQPDFTLAMDATSTDTSIKVRDWQNYTQFYALNKMRRDIIIFLRDGTQIMRRITNSTNQGDGTETLSLDAALGTDFTINDVARISFLKLCRLDANRIELPWITDDKMTINLRFAEGIS
jgi:hypothetical protein